MNDAKDSRDTIVSLTSLPYYAPINDLILEYFEGEEREKAFNALMEYTSDKTRLSLKSPRVSLGEVVDFVNETFSERRRLLPSKFSPFFDEDAFFATLDEAIF